MTHNEIPNLRHLRVFDAVAALGSISAAAPRVFLSQSAITQAISRLERRLDMRLFERQPDGMHLTEAGRCWQARVTRCLQYLQEGLRDSLRQHIASGRRSSQALPALLTTTQLKALIAVEKSGSFSLAGRQQNISQSSLHRAVRELEQLMDLRLFERDGREVRSTRACQLLARAVRLAFAELRQGLYELAALGHQEVGRIELGSMPLARTSLLPEVIKAFSADHPDIRISVMDAPYDDLLHHLRHGELDFLIGALRLPSPVEDIDQEALLSPPLTVVGRRGHPLAGDRLPDVATLARQAWVIPRPGTPTRQFFDNLFLEAGLDVPHRLVETSSQMLIRELLRGSDFLTLISSHQIEHELQEGILEVLPYPLEHTHRPIGLTLRRDWRPTPLQSEFLDRLRAAARQRRPHEASA